MSAASSSLPVGWINAWLATGVVGLVLFVAFPIAINQKSQVEYLRYQACANKTQTSQCEPSLVWAMNGWEVK